MGLMPLNHAIDGRPTFCGRWYLPNTQVGGSQQKIDPTFLALVRVTVYQMYPERDRSNALLLERPVTAFDKVGHLQGSSFW